MRVDVHRKAADGIRTRDPELGKLVLYQLSYRRNEVGILGAHPLPGTTARTTSVQPIGCGDAD